MINKKDLFSEFDTVSKKAWKQKIQVDLKGADYNKTLVWESPEGINVKPFYNAEDLENLSGNLLQRNNKWQAAELIAVNNTADTNIRIEKALQGGAECLVLKIDKPLLGIEEFMQGLNLGKIPMHIVLPISHTSALEEVSYFNKAYGNKIHFYSDIVGSFAASGKWFNSEEEDFAIFEKLQKNPHFPFSITINSNLYQNAGANIVQQLAYSLAHANEYLHYLDTKDSLKSIKEVTFFVSEGGNYFFEIAKIRALRLLWSVLADAYEIELNCKIIASPSKRNKTIYDYNTNLLRSTMETMSAILGGADIVYNRPYDFLYNNSNDFAERIARNQLLILKEESYFDLVNNPADGSYYIESLTNEMAEKALVLLKQIEKGGGFIKGLKTHQIQKKIKESDKKEKELVSSGKEVLVGSNKYPNPMDKMKMNLDKNPFPTRNPRQTRIEPIIPSRLTEVMEQNRLNHE